jgi:hypothetical protein
MLYALRINHFIQFLLANAIYSDSTFTFNLFFILIFEKDFSVKKYRKKIKSLFPKAFQIREFRIRKRIIITLKSLFFKNLKILNL